MPKYVIDLAAKYLPTDTRVWRMFPGFNYKFLGSFVKDGVVFLDLPGLTLPDGPTTKETPLLKERLIVAHETRLWTERYRAYLRSSQTGQPPTKPSQVPSDHTGKHWYRGHTIELGALYNLFDHAKKGDILVVPDRVFTRRIWIGEFADGPEMRIEQKVPELFLTESTIGRRVTWFPPVNELRVPEGVADVLRKQNPISLLSNEFYNSIFGLSYGTFYRPDEYSARLTIRGDDFDSQNAFDLGALTKFAALVAASNDMPNFEELLSKYQDIFVSAEFNPTISLNINSPGFGGLHSAKLTPILFGALFLLCSAASGAEPPKPADVVVTNSRSGMDDKCVVAVDQAVKNVLARVGFEQWQAMCGRTQRLQQTAKMAVDGKGISDQK